MVVQTSNGGFLFAKNTCSGSRDFIYRLKNSGAKTINLPDKDTILAAWPEFDGQGAWSNKNAAVAYDLDLTNQVDLKRLIDFEPNDNVESGLLLWKLYRKFGIKFLDKLRGSFGFALYDLNNNNILIATDFFGIRPVVYSHRNGQFIAASRIKHILYFSNISKEIDNEAIYHYLFFQAICSPLTIYRQISKLEPGNYLRYSNSSLKKDAYYDIPCIPDNSKSKSDWMNIIPTEIKKSIEVNLPLSLYEQTGCFLSGGTDSSSVSGYYTKLANKPAKTFSIGFEEPEYNELEYAHLVSKYFGTNQKDYYVTPKDVLMLLDELPVIYDEPFGNASVVPSYYCAKLGYESGVNTLLAGDGGDEIFGGNERYVKNLLFEKYFILPRVLRSSIVEPLLNRISGRGIIYKAHRYIRRANIKNPERFFSHNLLAEIKSDQIFNPEYLARIDTNCFLTLAKSLYSNAAPAHDTGRLMYIDLKFTITDNDLRKVTQTAEAAGVRVRYPLLDRDLVDFVSTIPPTLKVKFGKGRYIFKKAMEGFLPKEILIKKKHGMGLPIALWFKKDPRLREMLNDTLFSCSPKITEFVRPEYLKSLKSAFAEDSTSYYGDNLWVFLILELWLRNRMVT